MRHPITQHPSPFVQRSLPNPLVASPVPFDRNKSLQRSDRTLVPDVRIHVAGPEESERYHSCEFLPRLSSPSVTLEASRTRLRARGHFDEGSRVTGFGTNLACSLGGSVDVCHLLYIVQYKDLNSLDPPVLSSWPCKFLLSVSLVLPCSLLPGKPGFPFGPAVPTITQWPKPLRPANFSLQRRCGVNALYGAG